MNNIVDVNEIDFESKVLEESVKKLVVVDFWAPWCGPCKQLTPILEKVITPYPDKIILAKINIDQNQQIASQLRIQSIPTVFSFKNKQANNAFQGVIPETEIIKFLEKSLGNKLTSDFEEIYNDVQVFLDKKDFSKAKEMLENFIIENSEEVRGLCLYLECLIGLNKTQAAIEFLESIDDKIAKESEIIKITKKIKLIEASNKGPSIEKLMDDLSKAPKDLDIILKIADTYFANNKFDEAFNILLDHYPNNKDKVKLKLISFFDVLGLEHPLTNLYRKKLSSLMFS